MAYYSHTGNTRYLAELIADETGGTLLELTPAMPYPEEPDALSDQAGEEVRMGYCPLLSGELPDLSGYDPLFIGTPNWNGAMAPPVRSFLSQGDFAGKRVAPFCTHGGSGAGQIRREVSRLCRNALILSELAVYEHTAMPQAIRKWLHQIQYMEERNAKGETT